MAYIISIFIILTSCIPAIETLQLNDPIAPESGALLLTLDYENNQAFQSCTIELKNLKENEAFNVKLTKERDYLYIPSKPGSYQFTGVSCSQFDWSLKGHDSFKFPFNVYKDKISYVGHLFISSKSINAEQTSFESNLSFSKQEIEEVYSKLSSIQKDRLIFAYNGKKLTKRIIEAGSIKNVLKSANYSGKSPDLDQVNINPCLKEENQDIPFVLGQFNYKLSFKKGRLVEFNKVLQESTMLPSTIKCIEKNLKSVRLGNQQFLKIKVYSDS